MEGQLPAILLSFLLPLSAMTSVSASTVTAITAVPAVMHNALSAQNAINSTALPHPTLYTAHNDPHPIHLSSPIDSLYAQTLKQLADSLSLIKQPTDDRIQRLVALCPRLPAINTADKHQSTAATNHRTSTGKPDGYHLLPPASKGGQVDGSAEQSVGSGLFPSITLAAAWRVLEKSLFHNQLYGANTDDIAQSVTSQLHSHRSEADKAALQHNGDGGVHVSAPTDIPPTPYPDTTPLIAPSATLDFTANSPFTPHSTLDDRSQTALLALLRYLLQSHNSSYIHSLLPLVLRYLLSLPYFSWHNRPAVTATSTSRERKDASLHALFLSHHPASPFAADVLTLLIHLSLRNKGSVSLAVNSALLLTLRQLVLLHINTPFFLSPSQSLSASERHLLTSCQYVLQGLLFALGEQSLAHDAFTARELFNLLLALLSFAPSPVFHALTLRALVLLLQSSSELFDEASLQQLTPHIHSSSTTSYKRLTSPSSSSQHYSTLILTHSLTLSLLCALHSPSLKPVTLGQYKETLDICLNSKTDEDGAVKVMVGCVDVCDCAMRGMCELARRYIDLIPSMIDTIRSIVVTSRRLATHPKQKPLRALFTHAIGNICNQELATTPYAVSLTRSFVQSSLSSVLKDDDRRDDPIYQRQLVLLLDVVAMLAQEEVSGQVAGLVCQRFSGRSGALWLIVPQLTEIALQLKSGKEVDNIVTLFINSYTNKPVPTLATAGSGPVSLPSNSSSTFVSVANSATLMPPSRAGSVSEEVPVGSGFTSIPPTFSHNNLASLSRQPSVNDTAANRAALMDAIPLALCRLAQGMGDEEKRIAMMRRLMRLFSEMAYDLINEQVRAKGGGPLRGSSEGRVEACGALLPALGSLLCPEFYHQHGNHVENMAMSQLALTTRLSSSLLTANMLATLAPAPTGPSTAVSRLTLPSSHPMQFTSSSSANSSSQELIGVRIYSSRESNVKWFRRCWYILTHFDFINPRTASPTQLAAVRAIAAHSPVLLIDNKRDYLTTELELEAQRFPSPLPQPAMQRYLTQLMPQLQPAVVSALTLPQILYLSAVYHLETIRVKSDSGYGFAPMFAYIADEDINKGGMAAAVNGIADSVYQLFVEQLATRDRTDTVRTKEDLEKHTNFLLGKVCSRYVSERQAASSMLKRLVSRFPSVQWSSSCLTTLLTLYHRLNDSIDTETALSPASSIALPFSLSPTSAAASDLEVPEDLALRKQIRDSLQRTAQDWLNNAHYLVPQETLTVIQSYIQSSSASESTASSLLSPLSSTSSGHAGISLTLKGGQFAADMEQGLSALVAALGKKEQYLGEMRGIYLRWKFERHRDEEKEKLIAGTSAAVVGADTEGFGAMISTYLIKTGNELLSEYRSLTCPMCHPQPAISALSKSGVPTAAIAAAVSTAATYDSVCRRLEQVILHAAALLVFSTMEPSITLPMQDLLHLTCKLPAQLFVPSLVSSAVFCWDWVLSASKSMEVMLLIEMKAAWGYVIDRQLGLFGGKKQAANSYSTTAKPFTTSSQAAFVCERHPSELCEPYHPPSNLTPAEQLYESITPHVHWVRFLAIHFKYLVSFSRDSINVLASMLHKAFARSELLSSAAQSFGARFRLVALGFHLVQGGGLEYRDRQLLRDRVYSVAFGWFYSRPGWYDVGSVSALKEDVDVILGVRRALQNEDKYWRADTPVTSTQTASANNLYTTDATTDSRVVRLGAYRDLLLLLLAHEMERIIIWHNPGTPGHPLTNLTFTDQHLLTSHRNITPAEWQQYTHTAWSIAPILSLRISQRYPTNQPITSTLRQLVKAHPEQVYDISDAVMYLVTEDNVRISAPELRNLVYWAPTSLTNALLMFQEPYCHHRMVMEYAVHTLYCLPEVDSRVLTNHGFLFLDEVERLIERGEEVLYASFKRNSANAVCGDDVMQGELVYRRGDLMIVPEQHAPTHLLCFNSENGEGGHALVSSVDDAVETARSDNRHLSLRVTPDHRMYGQVGRLDGKEKVWNHTIAQPPGLVTASQLLPECNETCEEDNSFRMLACADKGRTPTADEAAFVHDCVQRRLRLSDEQFPHFLEFFGFWLAHGCLQYTQVAHASNAVCCSRVEADDVNFLRKSVALMGLQSDDVCWRTDKMAQRDAQDNLTTTLSIVAPHWFVFFDDEYGSAFRPTSSLSLSFTTTTMRSVAVCDPLSPTSIHRVSSSVDSMCDWDEAEYGLQEMDEDGLVKLAVDDDDTRHAGQPRDLDHSTEAAAAWLPRWVLFGLTPLEAARVIEGLWRADGAWKSKENVIHTSSERLRDQLMQLFMHAGFSAYPRLLYLADAVCAYEWRNSVEDSTVYTVEYVHSLSEKEQARYSPVKATTDGWAVTWATTDSTSGQTACWPTIRCRQEIQKESYDRSRDGRIWCVQLRDVEDEDRIIVAQRAVRDERGVVTEQSRPIFTGNCHPVDQVVFYLEQIIQSLRNDSFGLLYDFLLKSSHFSILLSHQLIWLCQAELGEVKDTGKPLEMTPFRVLCQSLLDTIIANFTPAERSYYRDEVGFFEQVTAISGILKPLPTKQERKAKIKAELEKIELKKGLYLPTNPHLQVQEIICKSGTPMRSAAKVPILVAFVVSEGELREDWIRNGGREEEIRRARSLSAIRAQTQHVESGGVGNGPMGSKLASAEERKQAKAERSAQEEKENHKVADKYPVVIDTADDANKNPQPKLLQRHLSDSSINRHISPSSLQQPAALDDTLDTTVDDDNHTHALATLPLIDQPSTQPSAPTFPQACIFKVGDDCRQDALALQIIQWCKTIFQLHSLPLYLYPYRVLPNRTGEEGLIGGIIEVSRTLHFRCRACCWDPTLALSSDQPALSLCLSLSLFLSVVLRGTSVYRPLRPATRSVEPPVAASSNTTCPASAVRRAVPTNKLSATSSCPKQPTPSHHTSFK